MAPSVVTKVFKAPFAALLMTASFVMISRSPLESVSVVFPIDVVKRPLMIRVPTAVVAVAWTPSPALLIIA